MRKQMFSSVLPLLVISIFYTEAKAQVVLSAQLRPRTEYRNGQGAPLPKGAPAALFTSQRSRLSLALNNPRLKTNLSLQDVRVWGQDVSTINRYTITTNNSLMLHEAWAEVLLSDTSAATALSVKVGRQEIAYDDQRLLGNLDWLQQGRRHDAAIMKYDAHKFSLHVGMAFNQNKESATGVVYNTNSPGYPATTNNGSMYKSMQFLYASHKLNKGSLSFLFFTDQFSRYNQDTVAGLLEKQFVKGVWLRATTGVYINKQISSASLTASAYYQFGVNAYGQKVNATMLTAQVLNKFGKLTAGPGIDYTSGSDANATGAFDPLYGTPHKFWGLMDYYYAGNGFGSGGLINTHIKSRYTITDSWSFSADLHQFNTAAFKGNLGQEIDLTSTYNLTKDISIEGGYGHYFTTSSLTSPQVKKVSIPKHYANWAYVMLNIKPSFLLTK